jgi:hypothetical protein
MLILLLFLSISFMLIVFFGFRQHVCTKPHATTVHCVHTDVFLVFVSIMVSVNSNNQYLVITHSAILLWSEHWKQPLLVGATACILTPQYFIPTNFCSLENFCPTIDRPGRVPFSIFNHT